MAPRDASPHVRAAWLTAGFVLIVAGLAISVRQTARAEMVELLRRHVATTAALVAARLDGADLASVQTPADVSGEAFRRVHRALNDVRQLAPEIVYLYTLRPGEGPAPWRFIVDADLDGRDPDGNGRIGTDEQGVTPGTPYPEDFPAMRRAFREGRVGADADFLRDAWGLLLSGYAPVRDSAGAITGVLGVDVRADRLAARLWWVDVAVAVLALLVSLLGSAAILLADRARRLYRGALALQRKYFQATVQLAKFVPVGVRRAVERDPDALDSAKQTRDLTVLFVDVAGYTAMSEVLSSERINHLIERYFSAFLDVLHEEGGDVNETAGDGLMVLFLEGAPEEHARRAACAALRLLSTCQQLNARFRGDHDAVRIRIGLNSGEAALGVTRLAGAVVERWTYTATGPVTNVAARVCAAAAEGTAVATGESAARLGDAFGMHELGAQRLKNVAEPVRLVRLESGPGQREQREEER